MTDTIYHRDIDGNLVAMTERPYESEDVFQRLLEEHPDLLAGSQISPRSPRRWLLIAREVTVPDAAAASGRWSLDHLFIDQDGIPTLVEVKRATDTRIRREVVGQMLDYAANGIVYWPVEHALAEFNTACDRKGIEPEACILEALGREDADELWKAVDTNLRAGRIRMLFVADNIPAELQRIIEFLNEQMRPAEVLGVAVKQFVGADGSTTLVPRVVGLTGEAQQKKSISTSPQGRAWDEQSFLAYLYTERSQADAEAAEILIRWAENQGLELRWGKNSQRSLLHVYTRGLEPNVGLFAISSEWRTATVFLIMYDLLKHPAYADQSTRLALLEDLNKSPGMRFDLERVDRYPSTPLMPLRDPEANAQFQAVWKRALERMALS